MQNVTSLPFSAQINLVNGDAKTFPFSKGYDVIVSNPPFYENELSSTDQKKNIAHHQSGLLVKGLLSVVKSVLAPKGIFYFLLPYKRDDEIRRALLEKDFAILKIVFVRQSSGHDYFRIMVSGKLKDENETETLVDEISIWNDQKLYTDEFSNLLKEFYLHL
jgi:tRNA1Val (adenine37-N6)-methyltransferase